MEEINSSFFTEFQKVFTFIFMSSWHRKESNCRDKSYNLKGAWLQRQLLLDLQALEHFPNSPRIILWPWSQITTNTQISPMQELEAISVLGRKLYFAASWRCPDTRAAALTSHKDNVASPQPWILIFHSQLPFLHKIKHPTATAAQNCQKSRSTWILFAINGCLWQTEVWFHQENRSIVFL